MVAMTELGMLPRSIIAAVTEAFTPDRLSLDERRFLTGPFVVHESAWNDTRPKWLSDVAGGERVAIAFGKAAPGLIVGPAEIAMVMYGASLDAPMPRDYAELYLWAAVSAVAKRDKRDAAAIFGVMNMQPIENDDVLAPSGRLHNAYSRLAHDVRRKVIAAATGRDRQERREAREHEQQQPQPEPEFVQRNLFGD